MITTVKFTYNPIGHLGVYGYRCNQSGDQSGEYVPLAEYQALERDYDKIAALARSFVDTLKERESSWNQTAETTQRVGEIVAHSLTDEVEKLRADNAALARRVIQVSEQLFSDPDLSPNWHWKDYLMDLDKLAVDCRQVLEATD